MFNPNLLIALVIGSPIILIGFIFLLMYVISRMLGYRTRGKILGAIRRTRIKEKNGERRVKVNHSLVYEYTDKEGQTRVGTGSEWRGHYKKLPTGRELDLLVIPTAAYDDVYQAGDHNALIAGGLTLLAGLGVFLAATQNVWFWIPFLSVILLAFMVCLILIPRTDTSKRPLPDHKDFTRDEVFPVEQIDS